MSINNSTDNFPPHSPTAIVTPHGRTSISAPAALVFDLIIDLSTYPEWNPFVPRAELLANASSSEPSTLEAPSAKITQDCPFRIYPVMKVLGFSVPNTTDVRCTLLSRPSSTASQEKQIYAAEWVQTNMSDSMLKTLRRTEVEVLGEAECEYRSWEWMEGPMAYVIKGTMVGALQRGFEESALGLKREAEERYRKKTGGS
ncbi:hypothetical protein LTS18_008759 [Coniosporium uncinatum]|uniref:Uncharacterized protein n=1 Tax=Coniosporium uncinatum TaxID=93489 RepID=A0ACC3DMT4_9PEZI|nr:hypothetical protein LTS18_008759 [Coniosporium uncinatum]